MVVTNEGRFCPVVGIVTNSSLKQLSGWVSSRPRVEIPGWLLQPGPWRQQGAALPQAVSGVAVRATGIHRCLGTLADASDFKGFGNCRKGSIFFP